MPPFSTVYSVSSLTSLIKEVLETSFPTVEVEGEISNFRPSSTGHWYFSLKDNSSMISGVMFRGKTGNVGFTPADGQKVVVKGDLSVYSKRGTYQIVCTSMKLSGKGDILAMLEERKRKLAALGYFDSGNKKQIPPFPSRIAVITSPTGAAVRDILQVLGRRSSGIDVVILPAPVQGEGAAAEIAAQIRRANTFNLGDVIITGRGGGSLEDLLPFSDEDVVKAVYESEIPVISAVGHEIDISLSDLAADKSAPTPSAAAEIVSESREQLAQRVENLRSMISENIFTRLERIHLLLERFKPENLENSFRQIVQPFMLRLDDGKETLVNLFAGYLTEKRHHLKVITTELTTNSPVEIMKKGYSVVTLKGNGKLITDSRQLKKDSSVAIRFASGSAEGIIEEINHENL